MKLTVLGNNGPFPGAGGACSSYLIEENGTNILFDSGSGSLSNLMKIIDPVKLDCIVLSHLHWDHITDIPVLFYYLNIMSLQDRSIQKIPLYLPKTPIGTFEIINGFSSFKPKMLSDESIINLEGLTITTKRMTHSVESYALKCESNGKSIVYSPPKNTRVFRRGMNWGNSLVPLKIALVLVPNMAHKYLKNSI